MPFWKKIDSEKRIFTLKRSNKYFFLKLFWSESGILLISVSIFFTPCPHRIHDRFQTVPDLCQSIFHPRRHFRINLTCKQSGFFHLAKLGSENFLAHMPDGFF